MAKRTTVTRNGNTYELPALYYIKLFKEREHQGAKKKAMVVITTHNPRVMPKYYADRGWAFMGAEKSHA